MTSTSRPYDAVILDLDGVITRTAEIHARAWKRAFDELLSAMDDQPPFDIASDYFAFVDGKPRYDGVRSFLASRGIRLEEGRADDAPAAQTVFGIGNRKNELFNSILSEEGVEVFDDVEAQLRRWQSSGLKTALVTSSRNGRAVLEATGLSGLFDVVVDGNDADELGLPGKPAPDIFLEAAGRLEVDPHRAAVVEDARAGVEAGRAGGFGLVVGILRRPATHADRTSNSSSSPGGHRAAEKDPGAVDAVRRRGAETLRERGADVVVSDLRELDLE